MQIAECAFCAAITSGFGALDAYGSFKFIIGAKEGTFAYLLLFNDFL